METTIPLPLIPYVDLAGGPPFQAGLKREQLGYLGCVYFSVTDNELEQLLGFLKGHNSIQSYVNASKISSEDDLISILDYGARTVFVTQKQLEGLKSYGTRVALVHDDVNGSELPAGGLLTIAGTEAIVSRYTTKAAKDATSPTVFTFVSSQDEVDLARKQHMVPIISANTLSADNKHSGSLLSVPEIIASSWTSDRDDKLIPTVVTDEGGVALGLVYSSQESLSESLKTGSGVYQSRKRGLWYKGETSGDTQELVRISLDCDQDCLKFVVRQKGHEGKEDNDHAQNGKRCAEETSKISFVLH